MTPIPPDETPDRDELRVRVHFLVDNELRRLGLRPGLARLVPIVGSAAWWAADDTVKITALLPLAEEWLSLDPDRMVLERLRSMSWDLSEAMHGRRGGPSHAELERRRADLGHLARQVSPDAAARWAATGSSQGGEGTAA